MSVNGGNYYLPTVHTTAGTGTVTVYPTLNNTGALYPVVLQPASVPSKRYSDDPVAWLRERVDETLAWAA